MLDFPEMISFRSNITTLRIMDPLSPEVTTAVHDWQRDARRNMNYTGFYVDRVKTDAALFNDAVQVFSSAFRESNGIRNIGSMTKRCANYMHEYDDDNNNGMPGEWEHGSDILQIMDKVHKITSFNKIHFQIFFTTNRIGRFDRKLKKG